MNAHDRGDRTRREVLGDAHVDRAADAATPLTAEFQDFITRYAWGEVWSRPGLPRHTRRLVTIATLAALGRDGELELHLRTALEDDVTIAELSELLMHVSLYAGLPAANHAFGVASRIIDETGIQTGGES